MRPADFLTTHPIFTRAEFTEALGAETARSPRTVTAHLERWKQQGRIHQVKQGVLVRLAQGGDLAATPVDFLSLASRMAPDAVLAYHSALEAWGFAQSLFERLTFATWTKTKPSRFLGREFIPVRPRSGLLKTGRSDQWVQTLERNGLEVRVTSPERTVVDVLDRPDLAGGIDEVWRSCSSVQALDLEEVESYVVALAKRTVAAKVGFYLDTHKDEFLVADSLLERLRARTPRAPVYMERRSEGRRVAKWNLLVPPDILHPDEEIDE